MTQNISDTFNKHWENTQENTHVYSILTDNSNINNHEYKDENRQRKAANKGTKTVVTNK